MRRSMLAVLLLLVAGLLAACATVSTSGNYTLESGETVQGDLIITSGNATLEAGSRVTGNVIATSGNLFVDGLVEGDILITSGNTELGPNAVVHGDVRATSGRVARAPGARVDGDISTNVSGFSVGFPFFSRFFFLCCLLPLGALFLILVLIIAVARRGPAPAVQAPPPAPVDDPAQTLRQLKELLDDGLISEEEYEAKRAEIIASM